MSAARLAGSEQYACHRQFGDHGSLGCLLVYSGEDTLFVRGRHFQISTLVSTQKLRLVSNAVRVNSQFFCIWRLTNQLEKDSLLEELTALVPKALHLLAEPAGMFHIRFKRVFQLGNGDGAAAGDGLQQAAGQQHSSPGRIYPSKPPWTQPTLWAPQEGFLLGISIHVAGGLDQL